MIKGYLSPLLALWVAMPLQAQPVKDYQAVYQILPLKGEKPIGEYRVAQRWDAQHNRYVQQASIAFSWKVLLSTHHYRYQDEVFYGTDNSLSYSIYEDNDGKTRTVRGSLPAQATVLTLAVEDSNGKSQKTVAKDQFDYSLFALRFPGRCNPQLTGTQRSARLLIPISGDVGVGLNRQVAFSELQLPSVKHPLRDLCQLESTGSDKEMNRQSWINRDGYLVYEVAARYRLLLVPEASHLPSNYQEKP